MRTASAPAGSTTERKSSYTSAIAAQISSSDTTCAEPPARVNPPGAVFDRAHALTGQTRFDQSRRAHLDVVHELRAEAPGRGADRAHRHAVRERARLAQRLSRARAQRAPQRVAPCRLHALTHARTRTRLSGAWLGSTPPPPSCPRPETPPGAAFVRNACLFAIPSTPGGGGGARSTCTPTTRMSGRTCRIHAATPCAPSCVQKKPPRTNRGGRTDRGSGLGGRAPR